jgi:glycosyltransferase involved in cell wall biosynthesis
MAFLLRTLGFNKMHIIIKNDVHLIAITEIWLNTPKKVCSPKCNERLIILPKVSVVVPVFNSTNSLALCAASILGQTYSDFELLFVNDGSTDNSAAVLEGICTADPRVRVIEQLNKGTGEARNNGIRQAKGEYICFVDSDDTVETDMLDMLLSAVAVGVDIVVCDFNEVLESGQIHIHSFAGPFGFEGFFKETLSFKSASSVWAKLFHRNLFPQNTCFFPINLRNNEDNATLYKLLFYADNIRFVAKPLYNWKRVSGSKSRNINGLRIRETVEVLAQRKHFLKEQNVFEGYLADSYSGVLHALVIRKYQIMRVKDSEMRDLYMQILHQTVMQSELIDKSELMSLRAQNIFCYWQFVFLSLDSISTKLGLDYHRYFDTKDWAYAISCMQDNVQPEICSLNYHLTKLGENEAYIYGVGESWTKLKVILDVKLKINGFIDKTFQSKDSSSQYNLDAVYLQMKSNSVILIASINQAEDIVKQIKNHAMYTEKHPVLVTYAGVFGSTIN